MDSGKNISALDRHIVRHINKKVDVIKNALKMTVRHEYRNGTVFYKFNGTTLKFYAPNDAIKKEVLQYLGENFNGGGQYKNFDVCGKTVVDVGCGMGDTPIYFALRGARHVYGYEIDLGKCQRAIKNVRLNGLQKRISIYHAAYSLRKKMLKHSVIKIDCEGCEYGLLLNTPKRLLKRYIEYVVEYHYGYKNLVKTLSDAGFRVSHARPKHSDEGMDVGLLRATLIE